MATLLGNLRSGLTGHELFVRVLPDEPREVRQVTLVEDLESTQGLLPGAVGVLTRASADGASGYLLDVLVRRAAEREVAGLVLRRSTRRSMTAEQLAQRGRVALFDVADDVDPALLLDAMGAAVAGGPRESLARLARVARWEAPLASGVDEILAQVSLLAGAELRYDPTGNGEFAVDVDGRTRGSVFSSDPGEAATVAARLAAASISITLTHRVRAEMLPVRSASAVLAQLLLSSQANVPTVSERARELGLPIDDWHCVTRLSLGSALPGGQGDVELSLDEIAEEVLALISHQSSEGRGSWSAAHPDDSVVVVCSTRADPRRTAVGFMQETMSEVFEQLLVRHPGLRGRIGIGTAHQGPTGLRISAEEARTALASARLSDEAMSVATFDTLGLRRMLAEWLVTDTARDTVSDLLAPLDALGSEKSAVAVMTLHAYLDERGSLQRAAARLHIHRNAVVYRMAQLSETLQLDLNDPDQRFALQLACRARVMTLGTG